jgi:hypothetical protein
MTQASTGGAARLIEPYEQGLEASMDGEGEEANPYHASTAAHVEWLEGHDQGEQNWIELCAGEVAAGRPHPDTL